MRPTAARRACPAAPRNVNGRKLGEFGNAQRLAEAAAAIQRIAVLAVPRRVLLPKRRQQSSGSPYLRCRAVCCAAASSRRPRCGFRFLPKSSSMQSVISWLCGSLPSREQASASARTSGAVSWPLSSVAWTQPTAFGASRAMQAASALAAISSAPRAPAFVSFSMRGGVRSPVSFWCQAAWLR